MKGKTLIANVYNITEEHIIDTVKNVLPLMDNIVIACKLNVVEQVSHQFFPIGATILYLLAESHLTIHTFPEDNRARIDLYCCNDSINLDDALECIYKFFGNNCKIAKIIL